MKADHGINPHGEDFPPRENILTMKKDIKLLNTIVKFVAKARQKSKKKSMKSDKITIKISGPSNTLTERSASHLSVPVANKLKAKAQKVRKKTKKRKTSSRTNSKRGTRSTSSRSGSKRGLRTKR